MNATRRPTREEFIAFWTKEETFAWRQLLPLVLYPGYLAIYVVIVRLIDPEGRFLLASLVVAVGYVFLAPYFYITGYQKRFARFIRCPNCGDWFGQDASGAYTGPNPLYRAIFETGRCGKCGEQTLSDHGNI